MPKFQLAPNSTRITQVPLLKRLLPELAHTESPDPNDVYLEFSSPAVSPGFLQAKTALYMNQENLFAPATDALNVVNRKLAHSKLPRIPLNAMTTGYNIPLKGLTRPDSYRLINRISRGEHPRHFAMTSSRVTGTNVLSLPAFLMFYNLSELEDGVQFAAHPKQRFCCAVLSNATATDRIAFIQQLSKYKSVDIFGKSALTNRTDPEFPVVEYGTYGQKAILTQLVRDNSKFFSQYKFVVCFENSFADDYVSEKIVNAIRGHTIPIYRGAANVGDYFDPESFVGYESSTRSYKRMIDKIIYLDQHDDAYQAMLNRPYISPLGTQNIETKVGEAHEMMRRISSIAQKL